jgi:hypothetical protein
MSSIQNNDFPMPFPMPEAVANATSTAELSVMQQVENTEMMAPSVSADRLELVFNSTGDQVLSATYYTLGRPESSISLEMQYHIDMANMTGNPSKYIVDDVNNYYKQFRLDVDF